MVRAGELVPGMFSSAAKEGEFEMSKLRAFCGSALGDGEGAQEAPVFDHAAEAASIDRLCRKGPPPAAKAKIPPDTGHSLSKEEKAVKGELAKAIHDRVRQNISQACDPPRDPKSTSGKLSSPTQNMAEANKKPHKMAEARPDNEWACFQAQGNDHMASRFLIPHDVGTLNRRQEQRPDPGWYNMTYDGVHDKKPAWDFGEKPITLGREKPEKSINAKLFGTQRTVTGNTAAAPTGAVPAAGSADLLGGPDLAADAFLTGTDLEADATAFPSSPEASAPSKSPTKDFKEKQNFQPMALGSPQRHGVKHLGLINPRCHVLMHEVSAPAKDLHEQDIRGYHKARYPHWDFAKTGGRKALLPDTRLPPGKYDYTLDCISSRVKVGVAFERQAGRDVCVRNLGYSAPPRVLHPDEESNQKSSSTLRRPIPDRSSAKDAVRPGAVFVNDFARELDRPGPAVASREYHDADDPAVDAIVMARKLSFDCDTANIPVTIRRDIAPNYSRMLPRGRQSMQGPRNICEDPGLRGSVGLGFKETTGQIERDVSALEGRSTQHRRADQGPKLEYGSEFYPTTTKNNYIAGYAHVHRGGLGMKCSPLRRLKAKSASALTPAPAEAPTNRSKGGFFTRESKEGACHFRSTAKAALRASRTHESLPDWGGSALPD